MDIKQLSLKRYEETQTRSEEETSTAGIAVWIVPRASLSALSSTIDVQLRADTSSVHGAPALVTSQPQQEHVISSQLATDYDKHSRQVHPERSRLDGLEKSRASLIVRVREGIRLSSGKFRVWLADRQKPYKALSAKGCFQHYYIDPLCFWWGNNERTLLSQSLATVEVQDQSKSKKVLINAGSHNYAGLYDMTSESEELQRLCLERLAFSDVKAVPSLAQALNKAVCQHFGVDFCYTSSSGYGANLLALQAILDHSWLLLMDEKSHSSMFTGAFLAAKGCMRKFRHNDMAHLGEILEELRPQYKHTLVAVEGFYSMDGTVPALAQLHQLKKHYKFELFCDEAHSFLSVGSSGRGCLELWNDEHPNATLPNELIDLRTAGLSKAVGGLGGIVFGATKFEDAVRSRFEHLYECRRESISSSTLVQGLYVLYQPQRLQRHLHHLRDVTLFCRGELTRLGLHVYGNATTPVLPIHVGRPSIACRLSYKLRQLGMLATPINTPAVKFWESRVRVTLSAGFSDDQVNDLLDRIVQASRSVGILGKTEIRRRRYAYTKSDMDTTPKGDEREACARHIEALIQKDATEQQNFQSDSKETFKRNCGAAVIQAGHASRAIYGLGSGGSRWVTGTFAAHLRLEHMLAKLTGQEAAMTFPNAELGLSSTIAALCRPLLGFRNHYLLVPSQADEMVTEGIRMASKKDMPRVLKYEDLDEIYGTVTAFSSRGTYFTLHIDTVVDGHMNDLPRILKELTRRKDKSGMTLLLNDTEGLGHHGPRRLGIADALDLGRMTVACDIQILTYGSFYRAFGLCGGFVTGSEVLIQELRYTSRGYMFSTSPQPFVMDMVRTALEMRSGDSWEGLYENDCRQSGFARA